MSSFILYPIIFIHFDVIIIVDDVDVPSFIYPI